MAKPHPAALALLLTLVASSASARTFAPSIVLDDGSFRYVGSWSHVSGKHDGRYGGTSSRSERRGATARIRFDGSALALYAVRGPAGGYGTVVLDGARTARLNFFAWHITPRALLYRTPLLPRAPHELDVIVDGTKPARSFGAFVNLDAAVVGDPIAVAAIRRPRRTIPPLVAAGSVTPAPAQPAFMAVIAGTIAVVAAAIVAVVLAARRRRRRMGVRTPPAYGIPSTAPRPLVDASNGTTSNGVVNGRAPAADAASNGSPADGSPTNDTSATAVPNTDGIAYTNGSSVTNGASHAHDAPIDWPRRLFPDAAIDDDGRRRVLTMLATNGRSIDPAVLAAAFEQERTPQMRAAVIATIRDGAYRDALPTVRLAYRQGDDALRTVAVGALARVGDYATIETALEDPSAVVATVAAYELIGAYGNERATSAIAARISDPVRRREITGTLGLFS